MRPQYLIDLEFLMCSAGTFYNNLINFIQYNKQAVHVKYIVIFVMIRILLLTYIFRI